MGDVEFDLECVARKNTFAWQAKISPGFPSAPAVSQTDSGSLTIYERGTPVNTDTIHPYSVVPEDSDHRPEIRFGGTWDDGIEDQPYQRPSVWFNFKVDTRFLYRRMGLLDISFVCQCDGNFLFDNKKWGFDIKPVKYIKTIGEWFMRTDGSRPSASQSFSARVFQSVLIEGGYVPEITFTLYPRLHAYTDDPPQPPEPKWWMRATCSLLCNHFDVSAEGYRYREVENVTGEEGELREDDWEVLGNV